jgi:peptide/nickel transport system ATP-binding protein
LPPGCAFAPRCGLALPECAAAMPALAEVAVAHRSRCIRWSAL